MWLINCFYRACRDVSGCYGLLMSMGVGKKRPSQRWRVAPECCAGQWNLLSWLSFEEFNADRGNSGAGEPGSVVHPLH